MTNQHPGSQGDNTHVREEMRVVLERALEWLDSLPTVDRAVVAQEWIVSLTELTEGHLADVRRAAVRQLYSDGWSQVALGDLLEISRQRIAQILEQ